MQRVVASREQLLVESRRCRLAVLRVLRPEEHRLVDLVPDHDVVDLWVANERAANVGTKLGALACVHRRVRAEPAGIEDDPLAAAGGEDTVE